jgi:hypothetical protein
MPIIISIKYCHILIQIKAVFMTFMASVYNSRFTTLTPLCGSFYSNFLNRFLLLKQNIHEQDLVVLRLKTSPQKVYGRHHELVDPYKISIS